ncbi:MAG: hypothetical protein ACSHWW_02180 [Nonlabens sp.]|uniref:hypothetical protein n=1 Tax=Nonlabens sp. TaxID=1888209 RepID=UPI003EF2E4DE
MFTIEELRENYENFDDDQIIKLINSDVKALTEPAIIVLKEQIVKRELSATYLEHINLERNFFSSREKEEIQRVIKYLKCPCCKQDLERLTGHSSSRRTGLFIAYTKSDKNYIVCSSCSKKTTKNDIIYSLFMGWWSAKSFFMNFYDIGNNIYKTNRREQLFEKMSSELIFYNTGFLRKNQCSKESINHIVKELYNPSYQEMEDFQNIYSQEKHQ